MSHSTSGGAGTGRVAIITGCASGIGLATTQLFLRHQYQVVGVDVNDIEEGKIEIEEQGRFLFHKADLMKDGECDEIVRVCVEKFGYALSFMTSGVRLSLRTWRDGRLHGTSQQVLNPFLFC